MNIRFPKGWDEDRVRELIAHYESQTEEEAIAEDEAAFEEQEGATVRLPSELLPRWDDSTAFRRELRAIFRRLGKSVAGRAKRPDPTPPHVPAVWAGASPAPTTLPAGPASDFGLSTHSHTGF